MNEALARRAVDSKHWRWMPGMLTDVGERVTDTETFYLGTLPDLTDPCTLGGLLALVRQARKDPTYLPTCLQGPPDAAWVVDRPSQIRKTWYESEAAALVAALEAAP